jgi:ribosomal protein S18 acetylase RimI-like enzyme
MAGGDLPFGLAPSGALTAYKPTLRERATDFVRRSLFSDDRAGQGKANRVMDVANVTPFGFGLDVYDAGREAGQGNFGTAGLMLGMSGLPGPGPKRVTPNITKSAPSPAEYIEPGSVMFRYSDPETGGFMDIVTRPKGQRSVSVIGLEVPEEFRGQGIGKALQDAVLKDFPSLMGQVSSKAAAVNAYKRGRRPINNPTATLEEIFKAIDEDSSINLATFEGN